MPTFADAVALSAFPIVDLTNIAEPLDGVLVAPPDVCRRHWQAGACEAHYQRLADGTDRDGLLVQCPYGFASLASASKGVRYALTGLIPFPRIGGDAEKRMAKQFGDNKVAADVIRESAHRLNQGIGRIDRVEEETIRKHAFALHEIRKLNRTIKQVAERKSSESPDDRDLLRIYKAAEMMSHQFAIIEILANESLAQLPTVAEKNLFPLFDSCARILELDAERPRIRLHAKPHRNTGPIYACDKTIAIVPTCLIENALKYSLPDRDIHVTIELSAARGQDLVIARVTNQARRTEPLSRRVFEKGFRQADGIEGSGHGLYLASLVARQHNGSLDVESRMINAEVCECTFILRLPQRK